MCPRKVMDVRAGGCITDVEVNSHAWQAGLRPGDIVHSINGFPLRDWIDYLDKSYPSCCVIEFFSQEAQAIVRKYIQKVDGEPMGISFASPVFDRVMNCANNCIFCFLQQSVPGLRPTLYIRDDDYRLSFLDGNYITLTNLTMTDLQRICQLKLSPLYISVHSTDEKVRNGMLRTKSALRPILDDLQMLSDNEIDMYIQLVICPYINDGENLRQTMLDLQAVSGVRKVALVPVGLTGHRQNCPQIHPFNKKNAQEIIALAASFPTNEGEAFFALADEIFLLAGNDIPEQGYYGEYELYDNGVGLVRDFIDGFRGALQQNRNYSFAQNLCRVCLLTSEAAQPFLEALMQEFAAVTKIRPQVLAVRNNFWGGGVNVAGLLTGVDIIKAIRDVTWDVRCFWIPDCMFETEANLTLDGLRIDDLRNATDVEFRMVATNGEALFRELKEVG